uniref:Uncharacterized protein n=1 Tax=Leersia perrieri TaxID=77586 RepID=A0A0D9WKD2_9ORYZ
MAALRLAARNLVVGTLRRQPPQVTAAAAVVREEQRRLIHGYLSPSPSTSCSLPRLLSSSAIGDPSSSSSRDKFVFI